ncbi:MULTISPECIES: LysR family transcriptional regulator [Cellulomonas]|uniref:DNA-binding transcriptional LysR family regulator n=1 Tax=Cellulomonas iranensis TaxID=76862 RepID=A0ABU0GGN5_9CELL|nr:MULTISPECIES: LysR family transcriptional regulator [Cellulomonas]MDQ0424511.1 DNA-binding transcriptional LysR family regulator [Cellulomonas iranensis]TFH70580.1 LysR family transcriptional regulator [Cellulomonas sp. HD19AZ1]
MHREPDLAALRALALVAELGSLSAAADRLGVSQQAVSLRVRGLEGTLRTQLLVRSARGSHLTREGQLVVGWSAGLLAAADDFTGVVGALRADRERTVRVAASLTIAEHLLPGWVARWRAERGDDDVVVRLESVNSAAVVEAVRAGQVDLGFVETPSVPSDLGSATFGHDTVEVVVPRHHPWAVAGTVRAVELAATPLVLREPGSGTRRALEDALAGAGHPLHAPPAAVLPTTLGVRSAVMAGVGPGALSALAVADDVRAGRLARVRVHALRITRPLTVLWAGARPSDAAADLVRVVREDADRTPLGVRH